jgi:hypothetical protein
MAERNEQRFSTLDVFLAGFLEAGGLEATLEKSNGTRVIFSFPQGDDLYRLISAFNSDEPVPVATFSSAVKSLRARMFALRDSQRGVG